MKLSIALLSTLASLCAVNAASSSNADTTGSCVTEISTVYYYSKETRSFPSASNTTSSTSLETTSSTSTSTTSLETTSSTSTSTTSLETTSSTSTSTTSLETTSSTSTSTTSLETTSSTSTSTTSLDTTSSTSTSTTSLETTASTSTSTSSSSSASTNSAETTQGTTTAAVTPATTSSTSSTATPTPVQTITNNLTSATDVCATITSTQTVTVTNDSTLQEDVNIIVYTPSNTCTTTKYISTSSNVDWCGQDNTATTTVVTTMDKIVETSIYHKVHVHEEQCSFDFERAYLEKHNELRSEMEDTNNLTWYSDLAAVAQGYSDEFVCGSGLVHSGNNLNGTSIGENLAIGYDFESAAGVQAWFNEIQYYNYSNPGFSESTGHFTQLVWAGTTLVGCGYKDCGAGIGYHITCNYIEIGNVIVSNAADPNYLFIDNVHEPLSSA